MAAAIDTSVPSAIPVSLTPGVAKKISWSRRQAVTIRFPVTAIPPPSIGQAFSFQVPLDGVSIMDSGNNALAIAVNTESVAEVRILVSNYQAEYGRNSGVQISAVTKSGTNQFHGSAFMINRRSKWNATNKANILNGVPKAYNKEQDLGFSIGGPIGKPGRENKLFFFYSHEFDPRSISITGREHLRQHGVLPFSDRAGARRRFFAEPRQ